MKVFCKQAPKYVGKDDTWLCEMDGLEYKPDFEKRVWIACDGKQERKFADKCHVLKALDCEFKE